MDKLITWKGYDKEERHGEIFGRINKTPPEGKEILAVYELDLAALKKEVEENGRIYLDDLIASRMRSFKLLEGDGNYYPRTECGTPAVYISVK